MEGLAKYVGVWVTGMVAYDSDKLSRFGGRL